MANGILIVDKPEGWTSQDVVAKLRGVYHEKRVGHGGTLDPMATGVLPVFFGRATRAVEFFEHAEKAYEATLCLGTVTNTQDSTGTVLQEAPVAVTEEDIRAVLPRFLGKQQQIPPMYSAIKIGGKKLYELARAGKEVERKPREIEIFRLELRGFDGVCCDLYIHCSKGTYVRTLCHDIGAALNCGGCMTALRRVRAGAYTVDESHPLSEVVAHPDPQTLLLPTDSLFSDFPALTLNHAQEKKCRNGAEFRSECADGTYRVYGADHTFLAVCIAKNQTIQTVKSFFEPL